MNEIKVLSVFGTRPEAIKMAPLIKLLENDKRFKSTVCVTGQHREMLDSVLEIFNIEPEFDLNIMSHGQTIVDISNRVLNGIDKVVRACKPDIVLVHGDTSTTINGALGAFYNKIPVGHIEAGLRSGDINSPFPEEANRRLTSVISHLHFAPTQRNKENLILENVDERKIYVTGNTVIDSLLMVVDENYKFENDVLNSIDFKNKKVVLLTTHRRENWGKPMEEIFKAIVELINTNDCLEIVFPMHKNPSIRELAKRYFKSYNDRVHLIEPLEYVEFTNLMSKVYMIMTDSGGIQEEAPAIGKPVLVLRTETERPEAVEAGTVKIVSPVKGKIYKEANRLINDDDAYEIMSNAKNPYGDGHASEKIIEIIFKELNCILK